MEDAEIRAGLSAIRTELEGVREAVERTAMETHKQDVALGKLTVLVERTVESLERIDEALFRGNGSPSIKVTIDRLAGQVKALEAARRENTGRSWTVGMAILAGLISLAVSAAMNWINR